MCNRRYQGPKPKSISDRRLKQDPKFKRMCNRSNKGPKIKRMCNSRYRGPKLKRTCNRRY